MRELNAADVESDYRQFGFKAGHSTALCTSVLKRSIDYYTMRGSHVFNALLILLRHLTELTNGNFSPCYWMIM